MDDLFRAQGRLLALRSGLEWEFEMELQVLQEWRADRTRSKIHPCISVHPGRPSLS